MEKTSKFWDNFFRKDLNLNSRWWHRFLLVAFVVAFIVVAWTSVINTQWPRYTKVELLSDRVDNAVRLIGDLIKSEERIGVHEPNVYGSLYSQNGGWLLRQEYYCSKNISSKVEEISARTGVNFYKGNLDLVSLSEFKSYLVQNDAMCISVSDLDNPELYGRAQKALSWGLFANDMAIWTPSTIKSVFWILQSVLWVVLGFAVLLIIYYQVFLYIVFGKRKVI